MGNLEHNIKEAFSEQAAQTALAAKDAMWNRLESQLGRKGVAAFWRVAAVFLGFLLSAGVFAALTNRAKQQTEIEKLKIENASILASLDSLQAIQPLEVQTEIQIIEKEKIVYRDRMEAANTDDDNAKNIWKEKYKNLSDSSETILASKEKIYSTEIKRLENELTEARREISETKESKVSNANNNQAAPFQLNSERINVGVNKNPAVKNPEMEMKVFQKKFIENRNNLNSTIFKK